MNDNSLNFIMLGNLAVSLAYLERKFDEQYGAALLADCAGEWVDDGE